MLVLALVGGSAFAWHASPVGRPRARSPVHMTVVSSEAAPRLAATAYFQPLQPGDVLESTAQHLTHCGGALALGGVLIAKICLILKGGCTIGMVAGIAVTALVGYEFADFGSGVYHWAMDNYGDKTTPIWGKQIEAFQGHHERPWTITHRETANNLHQPAQAAMPVLAAFMLVSNLYALVFGVTSLGFITICQELHKWAHMSKADALPLPESLQRAGLVIPRKDHLLHHRAPFENNYCIVSGHCNKLLDSTGFFLWLERRIYAINGVKPRSWTQDRFDFELAGAQRLRSSR